jgi:hypothetical protein
LAQDKQCRSHRLHRGGPERCGWKLPGTSGSVTVHDGECTMVSTIYSCLLR